MAHQVLTDCKLLVGGFNLSGDMNALALTYEAEAIDQSTMGVGTRAFMGGLKRILAQHAGYTQFGLGLTDDVLAAALGGVQVMTMAPLTGAEGEPGYSFQSLITKYAPLKGAVGQAQQFDVTGEASQGPLINGIFLINGARTTTGTGTIFNPGAASASQKLYAALHVLTVAGTATPTLTAKVQSAATGGFGSPTDRITFAAATAIGAQWATPVPGPITDAFWRISYTISGTTPSFVFAALMDIL
ncbi:MAG: hypothetical protein ACREMG_15375 [Gemmatimonadales bacterium]